MFRIGILTASDLGARGQRQDTSGRAIAEMLAPLGAEVAQYEIVPDERPVIEDRLRRWADQDKLDAIFTTGGTGLGPRDVTPEATLAVVDRLAPGLAEAMRLEGLKRTPLASLSRQVVGVRGRCLIVNLPGSPKGVRESLEAILSVLPHAIALLRGEPTQHEPTS